MVVSRKTDDVTPEIEEWRARSPIGRWLASKPDLARQRRKKLREQLGVQRVMLYYWQHGQALPRTEKFVRICAMIGVSQQSYLDWFNSYPGASGDEKCDGVQSPAATA